METNIIAKLKEDEKPAEGRKSDLDREVGPLTIIEWIFIAFCLIAVVTLLAAPML